MMRVAKVAGVAPVPVDVVDVEPLEFGAFIFVIVGIID